MREPLTPNLVNTSSNPYRIRGERPLHGFPRKVGHFFTLQNPILACLRPTS